jgi:Mrp family chromosome partitioning ATPase/capsular polysaccharide biosynthesis protein
VARDEPRAGNDWLQPPVEHGGFRSYLQAIRQRLWLVIVALAITVGVAAIYVFTAEPVYEAEADILVVPVPADETLLRTLGLIPESSDPTLDVETAAQLLDTPEIAAAAATELGEPEQDLADQVEVEPLPESNIVAVVGSGPTSAEARDIANAWAGAAVTARTDEMHQRIEAVLPRLRTQLETLPDGDAASELASEIARLETLLTEQDPTVRFETPATEPETPVSPRKVLTLILAIVAGLVIGIGGAWAFRVLDPTLRREEQLRQLYRLPILARVPRETGTGDNPLGPARVSPPVREAYRTLRATLVGARTPDEGPLSILVTGASPVEGKTTTAINLATSLAFGGARVILVDADLHRPAVGKTLGIEAGGDVVSVLLGERSLEDALMSVPAYGEGLQVLADNNARPEMAELFSMPEATRLIDRAEAIADYVIVDSPPLTEVVDTLPLARRVDKVLLVARLGKSRLSRIKELGELLAGNGIRPAGFALLGVSRQGRSEYYYTSTSPAGREPTELAEQTRASAERAGSGSIAAQTAQSSPRVLGEPPPERS